VTSVLAVLATSSYAGDWQVQQTVSAGTVTANQGTSAVGTGVSDSNQQVNMINVAPADTVGAGGVPVQTLGGAPALVYTQGGDPIGVSNSTQAVNSVHTDTLNSLTQRLVNLQSVNNQQDGVITGDSAQAINNAQSQSAAAGVLTTLAGANTVTQDVTTAGGVLLDQDGLDGGANNIVQAANRLSFANGISGANDIVQTFSAGTLDLNQSMNGDNVDQAVNIAESSAAGVANLTQDATITGGSFDILQSGSGDNNRQMVNAAIAAEDIDSVDQSIDWTTAGLDVGMTQTQTGTNNTQAGNLIYTTAATGDIGGVARPTQTMNATGANAPLTLTQNGAGTNNNQAIHAAIAVGGDIHGILQDTIAADVGYTLEQDSTGGGNDQAMGLIKAIAGDVTGNTGGIDQTFSATTGNIVQNQTGTALNDVQAAYIIEATAGSIGGGVITQNVTKSGAGNMLLGQLNAVGSHQAVNRMQAGANIDDDAQAISQITAAAADTIAGLNQDGSSANATQAFNSMQAGGNIGGGGALITQDFTKTGGGAGSMAMVQENTNLADQGFNLIDVGGTVDADTVTQSVDVGDAFTQLQDTTINGSNQALNLIDLNVNGVVSGTGLLQDATLVAHAKQQFDTSDSNQAINAVIVDGATAGGATFQFQQQVTIGGGGGLDLDQEGTDGSDQTGGNYAGI
jgi:hypothetical protein